MSEVDQGEFMPTVMFGFTLHGGKEVLHQMWVTPLGLTQWRPVPIIELGQQRNPSIAGYLEGDDEDS